MNTVQVIGTPVSPFVRKVLVCLELKSVPYEIDPVVAFYADPAFDDVNPLRLVPVLRDGDVVLADSTVICEYLDDAYPGYALLPRDPVHRARARWLEEYADTFLADILIWKLFNEAVINPSVWGTKRDVAAIERIISQEVPKVLSYLEQVLPETGFLFGYMGLADIAIAVHFRNAALARFHVSPAEWPVTAGFVDRVLGSAAFQTLAPMEDVLIKTPIADQRAELTALSVPLTQQTLLTDNPPQMGPLSKRTQP
jgi:glutathione S-transferase